MTTMMMSQLFQTTVLSNIEPLDRAVECGNDDQRNERGNLRFSSSPVDSITNPLECGYYKHAAANHVQPSESTSSSGQSSMECTDDSRAHGAKKECIQFPWKLHEMLDNADVEGFLDIVSWLPGSTNSFKVHQRGVFVEGIMPCYLKKIQCKSFQRQINMWGFECIKGGAGKGGYRYPNFVRDMRIKIKGTGTHPFVASEGQHCVPSLLLETVMIPNYLNPCVLDREKSNKTGAGFTDLLSCNLPGKSSVSPILALRRFFPGITLRKSCFLPFLLKTKCSSVKNAWSQQTS
jgi:hypothetical protein